MDCAVERAKAVWSACGASRGGGLAGLGMRKVERLGRERSEAIFRREASMSATTMWAKASWALRAAARRRPIAPAPKIRAVLL